MKKSIFKKIGGLFLGLAMGLGVAVGVTAGNKASEVKAAEATFSVWSPKTSSAAKLTWELDSCTITAEQNGGTAVNNYLKTSELRLYNKNIIRVKPNANYTISSVVFPKSLGTVRNNSNCSVSGTTITPTDGSKEFSTELTTTVKFTTSGGTVNYTKSAAGPTYTVVFDSNGGTGEIQSETVGVNEQYTIPSSKDIASPNGKVFDYWQGSNGTNYSVGETITAGTVSANTTLTLKAMWKDIPGKPTDLTELTISDGTGSITACKFLYSGDTSGGIDGRKGGTGSAGAWSVTVSVPTGAKKLVIYTIGWSSGSTTVSLNENYTTTSEITLGHDSGLSGNPAYTLDGESLYIDSYRQEFDLKNITSQTTLTISYTDRGAIWYAGYEMGNVKTLKSIAVETNPDKTSYNAGEKFQTTGMVVKATYGNSQGSDTTETITGYTCNPSTSTALTSSHNKVTISYTEGGVTKTTEVAIDVKYLNSIQVSQNPTKTSYRDGEVLDLTGLEITKTIKHSNGTGDDTTVLNSGVTYTISGNSVTSGTTKLSKGQTTVTASYTESGITKTTDIQITVGDPYVTSINPALAEYNLGPNDSIELVASVLPLTANQGYDVSIQSAIDENEETFENYSLSGKTLTINAANTVAATIVIEYTSTDIKSNGQHATNTATINVAGVRVPKLTGFTLTDDSEATYPTQYRKSGVVNLDLSGLTIIGVYDIENDNPSTFNKDDFTWNTSGREQMHIL